jgi:hypothetical protein
MAAQNRAHNAVSTDVPLQLIEVLMPSLSPTMEAGNITEWRKSEGT